MRSIRLRLILGTASVTALVLAICGAAIYVSIRAWLLKEFDGALSAKARALASMIEVKDSKLKLELDLSQLPEFQRPEHPDCFELWTGDGKVAARSPSLATRDLERFGPAGEGSARRQVVLPDGRSGRAIAIAFQPQGEDDLRPAITNEPPPLLVVAGDTGDMQRSLARVGWLLVIVCGTATVASAGSMVWVVQRGLKPVAVLAGSIARLDDSNLDQRIDLAGTPRELLPVTHRLNELLGRLEEAFAREKSFSSDVAHELRTPLAGVETALEVCASRPRKPEEYQQTIGKCLDAVRRMHGMVDNLLMLARVESHQATISRQPVALPELLDECWRLFAARAGERGLRVQFEVEPQCRLHTDREKLRLILHNLFDNAVNYTNAGGSIRIHAGFCADRLTLDISNSGSGLSQKEAEHVFERFWRGDAARAATGTHCGLGLTLCRRMVELLGGTIAVRCEQGGEFSIAMLFPAQAGTPQLVGAA